MLKEKVTVQASSLSPVAPDFIDQVLRSVLEVATEVRVRKERSHEAEEDLATIFYGSDTKVAIDETSRGHQERIEKTQVLESINRD